MANAWQAHSQKGIAPCGKLFKVLLVLQSKAFNEAFSIQGARLFLLLFIYENEGTSSLALNRAMRCHS
jgi:hypothetical protein